MINALVFQFRVLSLSVSTSAFVGRCLVDAFSDVSYFVASFFSAEAASVGRLSCFLGELL